MSELDSTPGTPTAEVSSPSPFEHERKRFPQSPVKEFKPFPTMACPDPSVPLTQGDSCDTELGSFGFASGFTFGTGIQPSCSKTSSIITIGAGGKNGVTTNTLKFPKEKPFKFSSGSRFQPMSMLSQEDSAFDQSGQMFGDDLSQYNTQG